MILIISLINAWVYMRVMKNLVAEKKNAHCIYLTQFKVGCFYKFRISYSYKISWRTYENKLKIF